MAKSCPRWVPRERRKVPLPDGRPRQDLRMRSAGEVISAMVAAFDTGCVDDVSAFVDDGYIDHQGLHGEEVRGAAGFVRVVHAAGVVIWDALAVGIEDLIEDGDRAVARLRWTGTRPTGEVAERETIEIVHVRAGRAVEHWGGRS